MQRELQVRLNVSFYAMPFHAILYLYEVPFNSRKLPSIYTAQNATKLWTIARTYIICCYVPQSYKTHTRIDTFSYKWPLKQRKSSKMCFIANFHLQFHFLMLLTSSSPAVGAYVIQPGDCLMATTTMCVCERRGQLLDIALD